MNSLKSIPTQVRQLLAARLGSHHRWWRLVLVAALALAMIAPAATPAHAHHTGVAVCQVYFFTSSGELEVLIFYEYADTEFSIDYINVCTMRTGELVQYMTESGAEVYYYHPIYNGWGWTYEDYD